MPCSLQRSLTSLAVLAILGLASFATSQEDPAIRIEQRRTAVAVHHGKRLLLEYRHADHPWKTYVARLCTPKGIDVLRVSPPDHVHHRGLMFATGVDDIDFWGEHYVPNPGRQRGGPLVELAASAAPGERHATLSQELEWFAGEPEQIFLLERRRVHVAVTEGEATVVTWSSRLALPQGRDEARLWGRPYFGLGARFVAAMDGAGRFVTKSGERGEVVRGDERLVRDPWCAYVAPVGDRRVTVAMFDHPDNPRHPATWFTMAQPFAYLAATLDLAKQPLELRKGQPVRLCYGVAVADGTLTTERIDELYRSWVTASTQRRTTGDRDIENTKR